MLFDVLISICYCSIYFIYHQMGNQLCDSQSRENYLQAIEEEQGKRRESQDKRHEEGKRKNKNRIQLASFPMVNKHVEQRIKKLTKVQKIVQKIWKIKGLNIIYANIQQGMEDQLPKGYIQLYKTKQNGDFLGYFQGKINDSYEIILHESIFVFFNASYFIGTSQSSGNYLNQVSNLSYSGGWANQQPQGKGLEKTNKGTYIGQYKEGLKEGQGKFEWSDGAIFEGLLQRGKIHGKGKIIDIKRGYTFEGEFEFGEKHGFGVEKREGEVYQGYFHKGKRFGKGKLTLSHGDQQLLVYEGNFSDNVPHGKGKLKKREKQTISGIWSEGRFITILSE